MLNMVCERKWGGGNFFVILFFTLLVWDLFWGYGGWVVKILLFSQDVINLLLYYICFKITKQYK